MAPTLQRFPCFIAGFAPGRKPLDRRSASLLPRAVVCRTLCRMRTRRSFAARASFVGAGLVSVALLGITAGRAQEGFGACLEGLRKAAVAGGVSAGTLDQALAGLQPNDVLHFQTEQPEFHTAVWDYMAGLVDDERVADGRSKAREWADRLGAIEQRFGVPAAVLVAIWGVESDFGRSFGARPIVQSLATLACFGQRPAYFRTELVAALTILQRGDVAADKLNGSWAGAFGHTQFMPSTFLRNAVDLEGTGHADIVSSVPDALATTANYLRKSGWVPGVPWGMEVKLPAGYAGPSGRKARHPPAFWAEKGLVRVDGQPLAGAEAGLLLPAGPAGPAFLVTRNFDALYAYNAAEVYALAIGALADRVAGGAAFATPWPVDDPGLSRVERRELQSLLQAKGYAVGNPDGVMGIKTLEAVASYEERIGMPRNGRPSLKVLHALRGGS